MLQSYLHHKNTSVPTNLTIGRAVFTFDVYFQSSCVNRTSTYSTVACSQFIPPMVLFFECELSETICLFDSTTSFFPASPYDYFCTNSNLFVHFSAAYDTIRDTLADFDITFSSYLPKLVLNAINSSWGDSAANLGLIRNSTSKEDFRTSINPCGWPKLSGLVDTSFY